MTDRDDLPRSRPPTTADTVAGMRARIDILQKQLEIATDLSAKSADALVAAELEMARLRAARIDGAEPIPMLLRCPACRARHIDAGRFATKPHHTHACQECGEVWRPAVVHTVGVKYLPGFKDEPDADRPCGDPACPWCPVPAG